MQHGHLSEVVAATLAAHAPHLARHWLERALAATPRRVAAGAGVPVGATADRGTAVADDPGADAGDAPTAADADVVHAEQVVRALAASLRSSQAASLVLVGDTAGAQAALDRAHQSQDARPTGEVIRLGWSAGRAAFAAGLSVHHVVRDADLLLAVVLADVERSLEEPGAVPDATAAEAFTVARRLHRATGRYGQAAASGFVHALLAELRERYRLLRHDLRNPLGTIRSALSLMEDETVPAETRHGPGIRAMVVRNAGSLDDLIALGLDDAAATALLAPSQEVGLRDVALAARREVREAARLAGCEIVVDLPDVGPSRVDGAALELTLTAVLLAGLTRAGAGGTLRIGYADAPGIEEDASEVLEVRVETAAGDPADGRSGDRPLGDGRPPDGAPDGGPGRWDDQGLRLAVALARDHRARIGAEPLVPRARDADAVLGALAGAASLYLRLPVDPAPDRPGA